MIRRRKEGNKVRKCHFADRKSHIDSPVIGWPSVECLFFNLRLRKVWHYVYGDVQRGRRGIELASSRDSFSMKLCIAALCIPLSRKTLANNQPFFQTGLRVCK
jgi:hypothetical protein